MSISSVANGAWATLDEVGKPSPTTKAIMRTLALRRIRLALLSDAIGADSNLEDLSTALGAAIYLSIFHFRSPSRSVFGLLNCTCNVDPTPAGSAAEVGRGGADLTRR